MGGRSWRSMFLTGILINFFIGQGSSIYFSQPEVKLTRTFIPESGLLYVVKAVAGPSELGQIKYDISKSTSALGNGKGAKSAKCLELVIDSNLGNISVSFPPRHKDADVTGIGEAGSSCTYKIVARVDDMSKEGHKDDEAEMTLHLIVKRLSILSSEDDCKSLSKNELCFGGIDHLDLQVMENAPVTPVAYLGSLPGMCGMFQLNYNVSDSRSQGVVSAAKASYEPLSNMLTTKANLDREAIEMYNISVSCNVWSTDAPNKYDIINATGTFRVLDENDNVLIGEDGSSHIISFISLSDHDHKLKPHDRLYTQDHSELLARDNDTKDVNNFRIYSLNDTKGLLTFDSIVYRVTGEVNSTAFLLQIRLSDTVKDVVPWDGYYCVAAVVNDSTVIPSKRGDLDMKYTVCVIWGQKPPPPKADRPSVDDLLSRLSRRVVETELPRTAQKHAPVLYPFPDLLEDMSESVPGLEFTLLHTLALVESDLGSDTNSADGSVMTTTAEYMNVFEVTPKMGIIHLIHPEFLRNSSVQSFHLQLLCNSSLIPSFVSNITITLESPVDSNGTSCDEELCSEHADSKSCELSCGYGSAGKCVWRQESGFNNSLSNDELLDEPSSSPLYPSCSPHPRTCPDGKCDELEQMANDLCPQDCASDIKGLAQLQRHSDGKSYGIQSCKGVLTCTRAKDHTTCDCAHLPPPIVESSLSPTSRPPNGKNLPLSTTADTECGSSCVMIYSAIALIAVGLIMFSVCVWKARVERKRKSRSVQSVIMTPGGIEITNGYRDNTGNGTLMSDAVYLPGGMSHTVMMVSDDQFAQNQILQVDSKWEIPRDDLLLEHVLGEGQFGRVLKGKLHGHGGSHPVAVKMLKVDAAEGSKSIWQEFLAEFSLLKQVDHPNVIKLLGACTTKGGPPYLVMEYAEYGALRSFLRKCRRVEKINGSHAALQWDNPDLSCSPSADPMDLEYTVTPREVLGFSWQIAKGMAYLSDMKMVHRDLAARNILLTKLKVCKISDFGLTRDIYVDDAYQKKSKDRVPVKWLAPECLADELYTTKSDVWAFGVLVWELTTLGASPYPGIQTEQLYSLLNAGYRMPQPQNCSNELYALMKRCWAYQPTQRPTFHQIVQELSKMLEDGIEYLKLDVQTVSNPGYDYFSQLEGSGSEMVNLDTANESPIHDIRPLNRRKVSMENLRLIDYEISTDDEFLSKRNSPPHSCTKHTYINDPTITEQDCSKMKPVISSSGYESPIRSAASIAV